MGVFGVMEGESCDFPGECRASRMLSQRVDQSRPMVYSLVEIYWKFTG